jgi:hypothetical protein
VLHEISTSITWLATLRDDRSQRVEMRLDAVRLQASLITEYRALLHEVDLSQDLKFTQKMLSRIQGALDAEE